MKKQITNIILVLLLGLMVFGGGCIINAGTCGSCGECDDCDDAGWFDGCSKTKYERTVQLSESLASGGTFAVQTRNGFINAHGAESSDCHVTATIIACARNKEDAQRIAEETEIKLERFGNKVTAKIERPFLGSRESVDASFDIKVPEQTSLELASRNGKISAEQIRGKVQIDTRNGRINCENIKGDIDISTRNGKVTTGQTEGNIQIDARNGKVGCEEVVGDVDISGRNGGIRVVYSQEAGPNPNVRVVTRNGGIDFAGPDNFSALVEVSTRNGSIQSKLPITVEGKLGKTLKGTIGSGEGRLELQTRNGSIKIR